MNIRSDHILQREATEKVEEIIRGMNGLSREGFLNKYHNDPYFHKGFDVLVRLFMDAKFK